MCVTKLELGGDAQLKVAAATVPKAKRETVRCAPRLRRLPPLEPAWSLQCVRACVQFYEVALLLNQKLDVEVTAESGEIQKVRRIVSLRRPHRAHSYSHLRTLEPH